MWSTTNWRGHEGQVVTILSRDEIGRLLGLRGPALRKRLQELRDEGRLIADKGRLTKRVRYEDPTARYGRVHRREHVLRGEPPVRRRPTTRLIYIDPRSLTGDPLDFAEELGDRDRVQAAEQNIERIKKGLRRKFVEAKRAPKRGTVTKLRPRKKS